MAAYSKSIKKLSMVMSSCLPPIPSHPLQPLTVPGSSADTSLLSISPKSLHQDDCGWDDVLTLFIQILSLKAH